MEVSHVKDHVTHAVIGGGQNIGFGISDSAEFFNILSSTLYKDQKLAVIREVLCNAWDAHIAAGKQDVPVQITLTRDEFIIRDYGLGIPHDKIGPIYTVYGNSTKKHDGQQTGGFGLGCKAPFAYTDHFEVISWSEGKKSIYNVSKSAAEVMGKPGMKLIMQSDCGTETGLQVRIKLKDPMDRNTFANLIQNIARNGEMNMELNHEKLETIPFSKMSLDFMITTRQLLASSNTVLLRYGNVVYPVDDHEGFSTEFTDACKIVATLGGGYDHYRYKSYYLVLQAPPHSISVTPSREELSMQDHTVGTLKKLLGAFVDRFHTNYESEAVKLLNECLDQVWKKKEYNELLTQDERIPGNVITDLSHQTQITTVPSLVRYHIAKQYPKIDGYRKMALTRRVDTMIANNWGNRGLLQAYRALINSVKDPSNHHGDGRDMSWFYNHVVSPLTRGMEKSDLLDKARLFTVGYGISEGNGAYKLTTGKYSKEMIRDVLTLESLPVNKYWPFIRNIVVLSYTRNDVAERIRRFPEVAERGGKMNYGFMLYVVPRNAARVEAARKHFQSKYGVTFIDMTVAAEWEHKTIAEPIEKVYVRRKKQPGWPSIKSIMTMKGDLIMDLGRQEGAARIADPEWYTFLTAKEKNNQLPQTLARYDRRETQAVLKLYGDKGAICLSKLNEEKLVAADVQPIETWVRDQVIEEIANSERIGRHFAEQALYAATKEPYDDHLNLIMRTPTLREKFGLGEGLDDRDRLLLILWEDIKTCWVSGYRQSHAPATELASVINKLQAPKELHSVVDKIRSSDILQFLDVAHLSSIFNDKKTSAVLFNKAMNLYLEALG